MFFSERAHHLLWLRWSDTVVWYIRIHLLQFYLAFNVHEVWNLSVPTDLLCHLSTTNYPYWGEPQKITVTSLGIRLIPVHFGFLKNRHFCDLTIHFAMEKCFPDRSSPRGEIPISGRLPPPFRFRFRRSTDARLRYPICVRLYDSHHMIEEGTLLVTGNTLSSSCWTLGSSGVSIGTSTLDHFCGASPEFRPPLFWFDGTAPIWPEI